MAFPKGSGDNMTAQTGHPEQEVKNIGLDLSGLPVFPIQAAVLDGFRHLRGINNIGMFQISDGTGNLQEPVIGPGGQPHMLKGVFKQGLGGLGKGAEFLEPVRRNLGIAEDTGTGEPLCLDISGGIDTLSDLRGAFPRGTGS